MRGGVVLIHGHGRTGASMRSLARAARAAGYATLSPSYGWRGLSLQQIVARIDPMVAAFEATHSGPLHFVTHSLGGLVVRALLAARRPERLGRVVMLAPPHGGSELADLLYRLRLNRWVLGAAGPHLRTGRQAADEAMLGSVDFDCGIIAADRPIDPILPRLLLPRPNDGKVTVAATRVEGMRDHIVLSASHTFMIRNRRVAAQAMAFLETGAFLR